MTLTFTFFGILLIGIPIGLWYAFAASILWGWFVVPIFNAPVLSAWQMFAVFLLIGLMRPFKGDDRKDDRPLDWNRIALIPVIPAISLGLGAIIKFWIL